MSAIKIYDADRYFREEGEMTCHTFGKIAIFEGSRGVVVAEKEAVHDVLDSLDDEFRFHLTNIPPSGSIYLLPTAYADIPIRDIYENAPSEEMDFYDFFSRRNYNSRCVSNFNYLCKHLWDIGYEIPKEPLNAKIKNVEDIRTPADSTRENYFEYDR